MAIKIKLNCNPYTRKNSLSYCDDSQEETELVWKFVRIRNGLLKDWLEAKGDWKGFFAELYEVFSSESVALFFLGIKEDYKKLIAAYQKYNKKEKMVVSFYINPRDLPLKDLPCESTDNISLDCFAPERIIEEITALFQLCQKIARDITDLPNNFITKCLEVIQSNLEPIEKICSLYENYNLYKEDFAKQEESACFENIKDEYLYRCPEKFLSLFDGNLDAIYQKMMDFKTEIKRMEYGFEDITNALEKESISDVYTVCVNGVPGGWVEAKDAEIRYRRFVHNVDEKYTDIFHKLAKPIDYPFINYITKPASIGTVLETQPKSCRAKSRRLMFGNDTQPMVEYIDLLDWSAIFLRTYIDAQKRQMDWCLYDNNANLKYLASDFLWRFVNKMRDIQMQIVRNRIVNTIIAYWMGISEFWQIDNGYLEYLRDDWEEYIKYTGMQKNFERDFF